VNLLPSVWKHHTLNPRLSIPTGISRDISEFGVILLGCFASYKEFFILSLKINCGDSIVHSPLRTQHHQVFTPICSPILMEANNCHHVILANYKIILAGSCEYNNEPS
jgi:hypothetical protein